MKIYSKYIKALSILIFTLVISISVNSQPPPPPGGGTNTGGNQNGGNAPIGSGAAILIGLAAAYGGRKYMLGKKDTDL